MATHTNLKSLFSDIADAIREKSGAAGTIVADVFPDKIRQIPSGERTASVQILSGGNQARVLYIRQDGVSSETDNVELRTLTVPLYSSILVITVSTTTPSVSGEINLIESVQNSMRQYYHFFSVKGDGSITP